MSLSKKQQKCLRLRLWIGQETTEIIFQTEFSLMKKRTYSFFLFEKPTKFKNHQQKWKDWVRKRSKSTLTSYFWNFFFFFSSFSFPKKTLLNAKNILEISCMHSFSCVIVSGLWGCVHRRTNLDCRQFSPFAKFSACRETFDSRHLLIWSLLYLLPNGCRRHSFFCPRHHRIMYFQRFFPILNFHCILNHACINRPVAKGWLVWQHRLFSSDSCNSPRVKKELYLYKKL